MEFDQYFLSLTEPERETYAIRAGTTTGYIRVHLVAPAHRRKIPRPDLIDGLANASNGNVSKQEVLNHFYSAESGATA